MSLGISTAGQGGIPARLANNASRQTVRRIQSPKLDAGVGRRILRDTRHQKVLFRPSQGDDNLLWPYLDDLEFLLLVVISGASILAMLILRRLAR